MTVTDLKFIVVILTGLIFISTAQAAEKVTPTPTENLPELSEKIPDRLYKILGPVGADMKTVAKARDQLRHEAEKMDADAVISVRCEEPGIHREGMTWRKEKAYCRGMAIQYTDHATSDGEITPKALKKMMESPAKIQIVDVREDWEVKKAKIPKSISIPLKDIPGAADQLEMDLPVVVYCHHGNRSKKAAEMLRKMGFKDVKSLSGGIDAYAVEVDNTIPRY